MSNSSNIQQTQNFGTNEINTIQKSSERLGVIETHYLHTEKQIDEIAKDVKDMKEARIKNLVWIGIAVASGILSNVIAIYIINLVSASFNKQ